MLLLLDISTLLVGKSVYRDDLSNGSDKLGTYNLSLYTQSLSGSGPITKSILSAQLGNPAKLEGSLARRKKRVKFARNWGLA